MQSDVSGLLAGPRAGRGWPRDAAPCFCWRIASRLSGSKITAPSPLFRRSGDFKHSVVPGAGTVLPQGIDGMESRGAASRLDTKECSH